MNVENIKRLMEGMRTHAVSMLGFDMSQWMGTPEYIDDAGHAADESGHVCGTTACGAGWAVAIFDGVAELERLAGASTLIAGFVENGCYARATHLLGLTQQQADRLFTDRTDSDVTIQDFVAACQTLLDTGKVFWPTLGEDESDWDDHLDEDDSIHDDPDAED